MNNETVLIIMMLSTIALMIAYIKELNSEKKDTK